MKNKLLAQGKMFRLSTTVITKVEFNELMKTGRTGELYESLKTTRTIYTAFIRWKESPRLK